MTYITGDTHGDFRRVAYFCDAAETKSDDILIIAQAGIRKTSKGNYPRIHDIRHTAAVRILENLDARNLDLNLYLPLLSVFLGHDTFWETEQYLQLPYYSFNRMQELTDILNIIPEVNEDE